MPVARRERTLKVPPERVWEVIEDPHHMPRWWPGVTRMEAVEDDRFTQVLMTKKGRPVRMDFHLIACEPPGAAGDAPGRCAWEQELEGTPFARVLSSAVTEIVLEPSPEGTRVKLEQNQKLRGYSRTGGFMMRRATRARLNEALEGLERVLTTP
jgi:uncharacterized protein YndB with AHSA1/START domain